MKFKKAFLLALNVVCRLLLGATFLFSGFVKVADPMGMTHKLYAYSSATGLPWGEYSLLLQMTAVALGTLEFVIGVYTLLGIRRKFTTRATALFMAAFTAMTVWIYIDNPVSDCGCFGDAVTLTNGQSLAKNIVLLAASLYLLYGPVRTRRIVSDRNSWLVSVYAWMYAIILGIYTLHYQPVLDFTPYRPGADIRSAVQGTDNGDGLNGRETAQLASFYLYDPHTGEDLTFPILADTGYTFILTLPTTEKADDGCNDRINDIYDFCRDHHHSFYMATASSPKGISDWIDRTGAAYPVVMAEKNELQTMSRSNPGLLLLHNGRLVAKWSNNDLPELDTPRATIASVTGKPSVSPTGKLVLWFIIPLFLIILGDTLWIGHKFYKHHLYVKRFKIKKIMRKKIVAGNWKMNKTLQEGVALAKELNEVLKADKPQCEVIICTPFIHLASVAGIIDQQVIGLGAENCADKESGAYTGEVSAAMVKSTGAQYVILGHSERRAYYHETPAILKDKVNLALENGLKVIFCIGEVLEDREAGKQNEVVKAQLEGSLFDLTAEQFANVILAYEPVWAIGTGKTATSDQAEEMHAFIRQTIAGKFGADAAENVSILYGGSCKPGNAKELFSKVDVDGGLIGGAALKAADFKGIIDAWKK